MSANLPPKSHSHEPRSRTIYPCVRPASLPTIHQENIQYILPKLGVCYSRNSSGFRVGAALTAMGGDGGIRVGNCAGSWALPVGTTRSSVECHVAPRRVRSGKAAVNRAHSKRWCDFPTPIARRRTPHPSVRGIQAGCTLCPPPLQSGRPGTSPTQPKTLPFLYRILPFFTGQPIYGGALPRRRYDFFMPNVIWRFSQNAPNPCVEHLETLAAGERVRWNGPPDSRR